MFQKPQDLKESRRAKAARLRSWIGEINWVHVREKLQNEESDALYV